MSSAKPTSGVPVLPRIDTSKPLYISVGSDFAGTVAHTLGNAGTGSDGFDSLIALPLSAFDSDFGGISGLDEFLLGAEFVDGAFAAQNIAPVLVDVQPFIDGGDNIASQPLGTVPSVSTDSPSNPAPNSAGGGGGGGTYIPPAPSQGPTPPETGGGTYGDPGFDGSGTGRWGYSYPAY